MYVYDSYVSGVRIFDAHLRCTYMHLRKDT